MRKYEEIIKDPPFAYLIGMFMADGCFYIKDKKYCAFEFYDGTSVKKELEYSLKHIKNIRNVIQKYFKINYSIRKRGNLYILCFKSEELASILINKFSINPGKKAAIVDIPNIYKYSLLDKYFWQGFMDGDGMTARNSRKVVLEVCSKKLIKSFRDFLYKTKIGFKYSERIIKNRKYYRITIPSLHVRCYHKKIGFKHPRKKAWLKKHIEKEFYKKNLINFKKVYNQEKLDYNSLFLNTNAYVEEGIKLILEYGGHLKDFPRRNIRFERIYNFLKNRGLTNKEINNKVSTFRWKMGKGSKYSIRLPYKFDKNLHDISRMIRVINYKILIPRNYSKLLNLDYKMIINRINNIFQTKPTFTGRGEPIYSSGVLSLFFSKIVTHKK